MASLTYTLRHIVSGDDTYEERDDTVIERTLHESEPVVLVPGAETMPRAYSIVTKGGDGAALQVELPAHAGQHQPLCFGSYDAANDLVTYLRLAGAASPASLGTARLVLSTIVPPDYVRPLGTADLAGLVAVRHLPGLTGSGGIGYLTPTGLTLYRHGPPARAMTVRMVVGRGASYQRP